MKKIRYLLLAGLLTISFFYLHHLASNQSVINTPEKVVVAESKKFAVNSTGCNDGDELTLRLNEQNNQMEYGCYSNGGISTVVFTFTDLANTTLNVLTLSDIVKITGISSTLPVTISGSGSPQFRICADATCSSVVQNWGNAEKTIANNQYLQLRINPTMNTLYSTSVKVGGVNDEWRVGTVYQGIYTDDVFSTYLYTGNGSTQTINNGIDLAGSGGMVWVKSRSVNVEHSLTDTIRGVGKCVSSQHTNGDTGFNSDNAVQTFNSNGFNVIKGIGNMINVSSESYVSWTFRKAPKFFDVVTYTGDGTSNRQIAHSLGIEPGMINTKSTSTAGDWNTYHRSATGDLKLNTTDAQTGSKTILPTASTTTFTVSGVANTNGVTYVAYLYAHDPAPDGKIQCGSFTPNNGLAVFVNLGWEPQFILTKRIGGVENWHMIDSMRGMDVVPNAKDLNPNMSNAEADSSNRQIPTATGFYALDAHSQAMVYCAIRRPNKPPVSSAGVYKSINYSGDGTASRTITGFGFPLDFAWHKGRGSLGQNSIISRLQGVPNNGMATNSTDAESDRTPTAFLQDGLITPTNAMYWEYNTGGYDHIVSGFRRAPGFFDIVATTSASTGNVIPSTTHNLSVTPEMIILKSRNTPGNWYVYHSGFGSNYKIILDGTDAKQSQSGFATVSNSTFSLSGPISNNITYIAYLFATLPGISKVGSYTGTGAQLDIDAGFATGPAFLLIKRTDSTGDWYLWDSTRGIVSAGNDPYLLLNSTAAEVTTTNYIDPINTGFRLTSSAPTALNASGGNYIYYSVAKP